MRILARFLLVLLAPFATAAELHLGLSPFLTSATRNQLGADLPPLLLNPRNLPAGTRVVVWDAWSLTRIADFAIPTHHQETSASRALALRQPLAKLGAWLRSPAPVVTGVAPGSSVLRAPEWLATVAALPVTSARTYLILGSPLYACPEEPAFDMTGTPPSYPADGHLALSLADSVFGVAGKCEHLAEKALLWVYPSDFTWASPLHREKVTRFWSLWTQEQGGVLALMGADFASAISLASTPRAQLRPVVAAQPDPDDAKPVMHPATPRLPPLLVQLEIPPPARPTDLSLNPVLPSSPSAPVPAPPAEAESARTTTPAPPADFVFPVPATFASGGTGLGIAWGARADLDIHAVPYPGAGVISFRRPRTAQGFLHQDERRATVGRFFEFVEFKQPLDRQRASIRVHRYSGHAGIIDGQVALFENGRVWVGTFRLPAASVNRGRGAERRSVDADWTDIRLLDLQETGAPLLARRPDQP